MGRVRRWTAVSLFVGFALALSYLLIVPRLVAAKLYAQLAACGYPDAQLHVDRVGLWQIELSGVTLRDGLSLGEVRLDAGLSMIWGDRLDEITIRGANVSSSALDASSGGAGHRANALPFRRLRIEDGTLAIHDTKVAVTGTIEVGSPQLIVDLDATLATLRTGGLVLRDIAGHVTSRGEQIQACLTGTLVGRTGDTRGHACTNGQLRGPSLDAGRYDGHVELLVPTAYLAGASAHVASISADLSGGLSDLQLRGTVRAKAVELPDQFQTRLADAEVAFALGASIDARGVTVSARAPHVVRVREARAVAADAALVAELATVTIPAGSIRIPANPIIWPRAPLAWTAPRLRWAGIHLTDASGTFSPRTHVVRWRADRVHRKELAFRAASGAVDGTRLTWRADRASWRDAGVVAASGTVDLERGVGHWAAARGQWGRARFVAPRGVVALDPSRFDQVSWRTMSGPFGIDLGAGDLRYRTTSETVRLERGTIAAGGGELIVQPTTLPLDAPADVLLRARGVQLGSLLAKLGRGRLRATGVVDGEITMHHDESGCSVKRGLLRTRGHGTVQIRDSGLRARLAASASTTASGLAVHQRVAAALADFDYSQLVAVIGPPGVGPDLRVWTRGRGKRVPQDLDLMITMRGVRDAADHLSRRVP